MSHFISFVRIPALAIRHHVWPLPPLSVLDEDRIPMHVWPQDIDFNLHMNNARYLSVMDYARMHLLARCRLLEHAIRSRWQPVVGAVWMTYRRSLPLFSAFTIASRLICWDDRWFYIEQRFIASEGLAAAGWVKGMLRGAHGSINPQEALERVVPGVVSPPMPDTIVQWNKLTREKLNALA